MGIVYTCNKCEYYKVFIIPNGKIGKDHNEIVAPAMHCKIPLESIKFIWWKKQICYTPTWCKKNQQYNY